MPEHDAQRKFNPFSNWWVGPDRQAIVDRYLECLASGIEEDEQRSDHCIVSLMMAPLEYSWHINLALVHGVVESKLEDVAAGPLEECLAKYGDQLIERVEAEAARDPKFRRALSGVWQNSMSDETYSRVKRAAS
jgi:hypothetical protein